MIVKLINKKTIIRVLGVLYISVLFIAVWSLLRYLNDNDTESITRTQLHEFYTQDQVDTLLMGASHCYVGLNPAVLDQALGCHSFNLGSSGQTVDITWLLMQEAVERYPIRHIYIDLSYNIATLSLDNTNNLTRTYIITDYLKPSIRKAVFLLCKSGEGNYANSFLVARRNWENLFSLKSVLTLIQMKRSPDYTGYAYPENENAKYVGKGFVINDNSVLDGSFFDSASSVLSQFDLSKIDPEWESILRKMIRFCEKRGIALTFISTPISSFRLMTYGDYDLFINYIRNIIKESGSNVEYYDFNLLKEAYWQDTSRYFYEYSHLNSHGAESFSNLFCSLVRGELSESELFYNSIKEKYQELDPAFYGLLKRDDDGDQSEYCLIANHPECLMFRVLSDVKEQNNVPFQSGNENAVFFLPSDYQGECCIQVSIDGNNDIINEYTIDLSQSYLMAEH